MWWLRTFFFLSRHSPPWLRRHCSTVDIVVAFKASGLCAMGKIAGVFGAHSVQGHRRWGRPCQGLLGALEKKPWAWGMSPNVKFHTPANPRTCSCIEQTHESNRMFLDEPWRLGHCFQSSCLLPLSFVINGKVSLWLAVDWFRWHLSIPQRRSWKCIRRPLTLPVSQGTGGSLFPSVRATRSDTVSVRLGNVKLGLDSKKKGILPATLEVWTEKKLSVEGTDEGTDYLYTHFTACTMHSMFRAHFGVPTFLRANFWWIAPI